MSGIADSYSLEQPSASDDSDVVYVGYRHQGRAIVEKRPDQERLTPARSLELATHSRSGFEWGCDVLARRNRRDFPSTAGPPVAPVRFQDRLSRRRRGGFHAASKAGLHGLTRALAREFGEEGVQVNAVAPGPVETEMNDEILTYLEAIDFRGHEDVDTHLPRYACDPEAVAHTIEFVLENGHIQGDIVNVNGGMQFQ